VATKRGHECHGHRYSTSLAGEFSSPSPFPSPIHLHRTELELEGDSLRCRPRAGTLPTYLAGNKKALSVGPKEDLPLDLKTRTPSQLSVLDEDATGSIWGAASPNVDIYWVVGVPQGRHWLYFFALD
jgi:hypothetical protein